MKMTKGMCVRCGAEYVRRGPKQKYCKTCSEIVVNEKKRERYLQQKEQKKKEPRKRKKKIPVNTRTWSTMELLCTRQAGPVCIEAKQAGLTYGQFVGQLYQAKERRDRKGISFPYTPYKEHSKYHVKYSGGCTL